MNSLRHIPRSRRQAAGFTLIEALIAFLVTAFGMLAIAGMQLTVSRNSEVAKQRSEAVRLAQQKIEELRSFEQVASDGTKFDYTSDVVSGGPETLSPTSGAYTTNTAFTRTWTITKDGTLAASGTDPQKWINVTVMWADRTSTTSNQSVTLNSVISRADPINLGTLLTGPGGTQVRRPKNRDINIPYPATALAGGKSSFKPPPSTTNYVFDDTTGDVLGFCDDAAIANSLASGTAISFAGTPTAGCTAQPGYVLSGYIRFLDSLPSGNEKSVDNGITNPTFATKELSVQVLFTGGISGTGTPAADCFAQRQKVVSVGNITVRDISGASRASNIVTITTAVNHGFSAGQIVAVNDVTNASFNGTFTIATASGNTFTYVQTGASATSSGGTPTPTATLVQQATIPETAQTSNISNASRTANVVTITTTTTHSFAVGQLISVSNVTNTSFNGTFPISAVTGTTFTYSQSGADATSTGGTPTPTATVMPPDDYDTVVSRFVAYTCIVRGLDDAVTPQPTQASTPRWWGQFVITPLQTSGDASVWTLSSSGSSNWKVCRFTGDYISDDVISNSEHPLHYRGVIGALDSQNYLVIPANLNCPTDSETNALGGDYINTNTVLHQTEAVATGASPYGGALSTGQWSSAGQEQPVVTTTPLPMF